LREAAGSALKETEIAKALRSQGMLVKTKDAEHLTIGYVPQVGKLKAYALARSEFGATGKNSDDTPFKMALGGFR
jgi:hypothetical protein